jgi:hypothetical protein
MLSPGYAGAEDQGISTTHRDSGAKVAFGQFFPTITATKGLITIGWWRAVIEAVDPLQFPVGVVLSLNSSYMPHHRPLHYSV